MSRPSDTSPVPGSREEEPPGDALLLERLVRGDANALAPLMDRYDRLVRYTIFRVARSECALDPQWLDGVASAAWMGFLQTLRRRGASGVKAPRVYLMQIARNQALTALRGLRRLETLDSDGPDNPEEPSFDEDLGTELDLWDNLAALHQCVAALPDDDRTLLGELAAISERRWNAAAAALGLQESTLRSRWKRLLERLRRCMAQTRPAGDFAPEAAPIDSSKGEA